MANFDESKHPRDGGGKFTDGNGGEAKRVFEEAQRLGIDTKGIDNLDVVKAKVEEKKRLQSDGESGKIKQRNGFIDIQLFAPGIEKQSPKELEKTIKSTEKKIAEHKDKIQNPRKHCSDWDEISQIKKEGRIRFWEKEIQNQAQQLEHANKLLQEKRDGKQ